MAVCRRGIALWAGCRRRHGCSSLAQGEAWWLKHPRELSVKSNLDARLHRPSRAISSISGALALPSCIRHQTVSRASIDSSQTHCNPHAGQPIRVPCEEEEREETVSVCVLVGPRNSVGQRTFVEVPAFGLTELSELLSPGTANSGAFLFPLTTVDGRREDDISVRGAGETKVPGRESFRRLFEAESCPAPFVRGSRFYCFHCPAADGFMGCMDKSRVTTGLEPRTSALLALAPVSYFAHSVTERGEGMDDRDREKEEKLALMHDKLREELPRFFLKSHDYSMYSPDVEFINGLLNTKTRGRVLYQLSLSLWKLLCACYFADMRLEVLKLTKHSEDGTVRARWRLRGLPFHVLLLRFYRRDKSSLYRTYDAFSTFYLGPEGLVRCHRVDKVMPAQPPVLPRITSVLAGALVALGLQEHRPALNLLPFLLSSFRIGLGRH
ncbi:uncharacterized protein LOC118784891 [Megalops cyprinoides]|uniref:uncharacterized protein LOC118784891 n=1 Tax=Megalops cyprinoides TaxID=118141 RepID=UPI001863E84E|nr:uncharacterized protein LOC118784891 [Megalops cyprinoides]XP_036395254.1 uncharacterized protein LOC118784891 [Megalops cyprinoides]